MNKEQWKDVVGYEQYYSVSDQGRVYSKRKRKYMTPAANSRGYLRVVLIGEHGKEKNFIHRLVATAFVDNPYGLPVVNHLDFNVLNNRADNLEWTTQGGNIKYSASAGRMKHEGEWKEKLIQANRRNGKPVIGKSLHSGELIFLECLRDSRLHGFIPGSVSCCCNGKRKTHKGYTFRFATPAEMENKLWNTK